MSGTAGLIRSDFSRMSSLVGDAGQSQAGGSHRRSPSTSGDGFPGLGRRQTSLLFCSGFASEHCDQPELFSLFFVVFYCPGLVESRSSKLSLGCLTYSCIWCLSSAKYYILWPKSCKSAEKGRTFVSLSPHPESRNSPNPG